MRSAAVTVALTTITCASACPTCRPIVREEVYGSFATNLPVLLLPLLLIGCIVPALHAQDAKAKDGL